MENEIGNAAGIIWDYLNKNGATPIAMLKRKTNLSTDLINRGIGWLAREGKLKFEVKDKDTVISLNIQ